MVEHQRGAELANRGRADTRISCRLEQRDFVQIVASEMLVHIPEHRVALKKWREAVTGPRHRKARVDRITKIASVAEIMACRHCGCIRRCEGRKQRMGILEIDSLIPDRGHRRRGLFRYHQCAKAIGYEEHYIVRRVAAEAGKMVQTPNIQHSAMICSFLTAFNSLSECGAFEPLLNGRVRQKYYGVLESVKPGAA